MKNPSFSNNFLHDFYAPLWIQQHKLAVCMLTWIYNKFLFKDDFQNLLEFFFRRYVVFFETGAFK